MKKNILGKTEIQVTELCFGTLPMGPLQKNLSVEECSELVYMALDKGINFIDTAQGYKVYESIRRALKKTQKRPIIGTKSHAKTYEDMQNAVEEALKSMDIDYVDIFHLHSSRDSVEVFETRKGAIQCLVDSKKKGLIKAVGISTHSAAVTKMVAQKEEFDVVFPIINMTGKGIVDGSIEEMKEGIAACVQNGKGIYLMKALAGGSLVGDYHKALRFVREIPGYAAIALGMVSVKELEFNLDYFNAENVNDYSHIKIDKSNKYFTVVKKLCKGCGLCKNICPNFAIDMQEGTAVIQQNKCLQCGYCVGACEQFAIRMV